MVFAGEPEFIKAVTPQTPRDYALLAQRAYSVPQQIGVESGAARAIVEDHFIERVIEAL